MVAYLLKQRGIEMTIREFLFKNNMTAACMARHLGINAHYLRLINRGAAKPSKQLADEIELFTGGQVKAEELRNIDV